MNQTHLQRTGILEPERYEQMKALLRSYPDITNEQVSQLSLYLRKGPMLDRSLLGSVPELQPQLSQFMADHRSDFSLGLLEYLVGAALLVLTFIGGYLLWDVSV